MNDEKIEECLLEKVEELAQDISRLHERFSVLNRKIDTTDFTLYLIKMEELNEKFSKNMQGLNNMILDVKGILSQVSTWRKHEQSK